MRAFRIAAAAAVGMTGVMATGTALGADIYTVPPVQSPAIHHGQPGKATDWSGVYLGIHGGYGWGRWSGNLTSRPDGYPDGGVWGPDDWGAVADTHFPGGAHRSIDGSGWLGGVQGGFNHQVDGIVWGLEADIAKTKIEGSGVFRTVDLSDIQCVAVPGPMWCAHPYHWSNTDYSNGDQAVYEKHIQVGLNWLGTVRGRVGFLVHPQTLIYGTGGLAVGGTSSKQQIYWDDGLGDDPLPLHASGAAENKTQWGWTIGAGIEHQLGGNWSIKADYLYADLGTVVNRYVGTSTGVPWNGMDGGVHDWDGFNPKLTVHAVRVGLNYKFGHTATGPISVGY